MLDDRLDPLLDAAREPDPSDDGFTERVISAVRAPDRAPSAWRRFVTRPVVLSAAAVLVAGAAFAAVRTVVPERRDAQAPQDVGKGAAVAPLPRREPQPSDAPRETSRPRGDATPSPTSGRRGSAEYGYTSSHTAYAMQGGLRLTTETYSNEFPAGQAARVTVTLENVTREAISFYAPRGCALTVGAGRESSDNQQRVWTCTGRGGDPRTQKETEQVVLAPGERRVEDAALALPEPGEWQVYGMCQCYRRTTTGERPRQTDAPVVDGFIQRPVPTPAQPGRTAVPDEDSSYRLSTPPIRVVAR